MRPLSVGDKVVFVSGIGKGPQQRHTLLRVARIDTVAGTLIRYGVGGDADECKCEDADICTEAEAHKIAAILGVAFEVVNHG